MASQKLNILNNSSSSGSDGDDNSDYDYDPNDSNFLKFFNLFINQFQILTIKKQLALE
jgi:hypothetical protein